MWGSVAVILLVIILYLTGKAANVEQILSSQASDRTQQTYKGAVLNTSKGAITIHFLTDKAPRTVQNFVTLADRDFYDGTKIHRVIRGFVIQGGDPFTKDDDESRYGKGGPGYTFQDEINDEPMVRGVVAMANAGRNTNGSQFFILIAGEAPWLQGKHTIFAKVVSGLEVADEISVVRTSDNDIPVAPIEVYSVDLLVN